MKQSVMSVVLSVVLAGCITNNANMPPKTPPTVMADKIGDFLQRQQHVPVTRLEESLFDLQIYPKTDSCTTTNLQEKMQYIQQLQENMVQFYISQLEQQIRRANMEDVQVALYSNPFHEKKWLALKKHMQATLETLTNDGILIYSTDQINQYNFTVNPNRSIRSVFVLPKVDENQLVIACGVRTVQLYAGQQWLKSHQAQHSQKVADASELVTFALSAEHAFATHHLNVMQQIQDFKVANQSTLSHLPLAVKSINDLFEEQLKSKLHALTSSTYLLPASRPAYIKRIPINSDCLAENISKCALSELSKERILYTELSQISWLHQYIHQAKEDRL